MTNSETTIILFAILIIYTIYKSVQIVPQSQKFIVERFGKFRAELGPGINLITPYIDQVAHRVSILERQLPSINQDAITSDNVLLRVEASVFYRIERPARTVYRIRDVDAAISTTVQGIIRSELGKIELDEVQSNRAQLTSTIKENLEEGLQEWGIEVTRAEILDVNLDKATREAMLQQLNAERARRAQVTEAEGKKRAVMLAADGELYAAKKTAEARRISAEAEAYATGIVAKALNENGIEAAQYQIALKQVEALGQMSAKEGNQTIVLPANAIDTFTNAFNLLKGAK